MDSPTTSPFLFVTCQAAAQLTVKNQLTRHEDVRLAFSRPGLITFKNTIQPIDEHITLPSVLARTWGVSLGPVKTVDEVVHRAANLSRPQESLRLHVFPREPFHEAQIAQGLESEPVYQTPRQGRGALDAQATRDLDLAIRQAAGSSDRDLFRTDLHAEPGDRVLDVILVDEQSWWLGVHRHSEDHSAFPGGYIPIEVPPRIASRAYRKIEEARIHFEIPLCEGDVAVEIGSAPGGTAEALIRRGIGVVGIDPLDVDARVLEARGPSNARFAHIAKPVRQVRREELPDRIDWLLLDMNLAPQVALRSAHRLADRMQSSLLGVVFTLKLNEWQFVDKVPDFVRRIQAMGVVRPRAWQLPSNRQEICVYGLTRRGLDRFDAMGR